MFLELEADPGSGLFGHQRHGGPFGVVVRCWRSFAPTRRATRTTAMREQPRRPPAEVRP